MNVPGRILLVSSSAVLAASGLFFLFLPEIPGSVVGAGSPEVLVMLQVLGGAWLGLGSLNWISRSTIIGGIYGRPIVLVNLTHFLVVSLSLLRFGLRGNMPDALWVACVITSMFAVLFAVKLYTHPREAGTG